MFICAEEVNGVLMPGSHKIPSQVMRKKSEFFGRVVYVGTREGYAPVYHLLWAAVRDTWLSQTVTNLPEMV